jgi:hypothetical protein
MTCARVSGTHTFRIWHGSATSTAAVELAAKWGDPVRRGARLVHRPDDRVAEKQASGECELAPQVHPDRPQR